MEYSVIGLLGRSDGLWIGGGRRHRPEKIKNAKNGNA